MLDVAELNAVDSKIFSSSNKSSLLNDGIPIRQDGFVCLSDGVLNEFERQPKVLYNFHRPSSNALFKRFKART